MAKKSDPNNSRGPHYDKATQKTIVAFLNSALQEAERSRADAEAKYKIYPELPGTEGALIYARNQCSAIKWLIVRAGQRQRHLAPKKPAKVTQED